jgi:hypothetical protein
LAFGQINTPGQMYFWRAADNVSQFAPLGGHAGHRKSPDGLVKVESSLDDARIGALTGHTGSYSRSRF